MTTLGVPFLWKPKVMSQPWLKNIGPLQLIAKAKRLRTGSYHLLETDKRHQGLEM